VALLARDGQPRQRQRRGAPPVESLRRAGKKQGGIVIVDGELNRDGGFRRAGMAESEIVVQVSTSAASITNAYGLIKRLARNSGAALRHPGHRRLRGRGERWFTIICRQAASRYLAVTLSSMGSVPADEYLHRAARLGRSVVDAFPLAGASVAFRQLAGRFACRDAAPGRSAHFGS
jgi:flagellar biosynthesis protein FlhG